MSLLFSRTMTANSDGRPALFQPRVLFRKAAVCPREKTPDEKRMKSRFAISSARRSISSSSNGRRINRGVSRTAMELMKTKPDEESRDCEYDRFVVDLRAAVKAASEA